MKKLLLITEGFYHYDNAIKEAIEKEGYEATLFQAQINLSVWERIVHKKDRKQYRQEKQRISQQFLLKEDHYDVVLVICGHSLDVDTFLQFRENHEDTTFILYLWDDVKRVETYEALKGCFDVIMTFDRYDAKEHGLQFRPLFYLDSYTYENQPKDYDICFMGWLHSDRREVISRILQNYFNQGESRYIYLFTGPLKRLKSKWAAKTKWDKVMNGYLHTKRLSQEESTEVLLKSKATLDIQHASQKGLTIRTIESLAAHTKLITSNPEVKYYDFYRENNVIMIDRENPVIDKAVLETPWEEIDEAIVEKYSLTAWVKDVLAYKPVKGNFLR